MKKSYFMSMLAVIMVALLNIGFTSCSNDDSDIPNIDGDPEGTVTVNLKRNSSESYSNMHIGEADVEFRSSCNLYINNGYIVSVGKVSGISEIMNIPNTGWSHQAAAIPGTGYVVRKENGPSYPVYVVDFIKDVYGNITAVTLKYRLNWRSNTD